MKNIHNKLLKIIISYLFLTMLFVFIGQYSIKDNENYIIKNQITYESNIKFDNYLNIIDNNLNNLGSRTKDGKTSEQVMKDSFNSLTPSAKKYLDIESIYAEPSFLIINTYNNKIKKNVLEDIVDDYNQNITNFISSYYSSFVRDAKEKFQIVGKAQLIKLEQYLTEYDKIFDTAYSSNDRSMREVADQIQNLINGYNKNYKTLNEKGYFRSDLEINIEKMKTRKDLDVLREMISKATPSTSPIFLDLEFTMKSLKNTSYIVNPNIIKSISNKPTMFSITIYSVLSSLFLFIILIYLKIQLSKVKLKRKLESLLDLI